MIFRAQKTTGPCKISITFKNDLVFNFTRFENLLQVAVLKIEKINEGYRNNRNKKLHGNACLQEIFKPVTTGAVNHNICLITNWGGKAGRGSNGHC